MTDNVRIRPYRIEDLPRVEALEARVQPYRPGDEAEVEAMYVRAQQAEQAGDPGWRTIPALPARPIEEEFEAFWVAEDNGAGAGDLVGIVGGQTLRAMEILPPDHPYVQRWQQRGRVAELRRLRVAPDRRRGGIGERLCETVLQWARQEKYDTLVVNTTTPQVPALALYRKLGFREVGVSYIGRYELTWLELLL